jgi:hypothetical protein
MPTLFVKIGEIVGGGRWVSLRRAAIRGDDHQPTKGALGGEKDELRHREDEGMTYPEPRFLGDDGEITATYRQADHDPELTHPNGNTVHYLATGASTNGQFGLYRWEMGPERSGPDPHFHRSISESFFVLTGTVRFYQGTSWIDTRPSGATSRFA